MLLNLSLIPLVYSAGLMVGRFVKSHWRVTQLSSLLAFVISTVILGSELVNAGASHSHHPLLAAIVAVLVTFLGWIIANFSENYIAGEPRQRLFTTSLLFTLFSVLLIVSQQHLVLMFIGWTLSSVGLHFLLTFYQERKIALLVAHKKFLISRLAEVLMLIALVLIYKHCGTLEIDEIKHFVQLSSEEQVRSALTIPSVLIVLAVILKSAQLPLHGWLIQVMESPTPVSALLHAGVINIGGYILLSIAFMVSAVPAAQWLLVLVGLTTAVLAGLVMTTRTSIKVRLAWSTCSQIGFMLMEIGLGLYEIALLHLIGHSLYKAHAFLNSGTIVEDTRVNQLIEVKKHPLRPWVMLGAFSLSMLISASSFYVWEIKLHVEWATWIIPMLIFSLGISAMHWHHPDSTAFDWIRSAVYSLILTNLYIVWHLSLHPVFKDAHSMNPYLLGLVGLVFSLFYCMQTLMKTEFTAAWMEKIHPLVLSGFRLDEMFTRFTLKYWPIKSS